MVVMMAAPKAVKMVVWRVETLTDVQALQRVDTSVDWTDDIMVDLKAVMMD